MIEQRDKIVAALITAGMIESNIILDDFTIPQNFPAALVLPVLGTGEDKTSEGYAEYKIKFGVYLIFNPKASTDVYSDAYSIFNKLRKALISAYEPDIKQVVFYGSTAGALSVLVGKMELEV